MTVQQKSSGIQICQIQSELQITFLSLFKKLFNRTLHSSGLYNDAASTLVFHVNETSQDKLTITQKCILTIVFQENFKVKHENVFISPC